MHYLTFCGTLFKEVRQMKKTVIKLVVITGVLVLLSGCGNGDGNPFGTTEESYSYKTPSTTAPYVYETKESEVYYYTQSTPDSSAATTSSQATTIFNVTQQNPVVTPTDAPATTEKVYEKTGEMAFSDDANNKYIKAIVNKYGVNAENLVALYTVPDNDGNIVLEFDGSRDNNGKPIRNKDTLISIYSVDKSLNSKRASENSSLNEYSYGEMKVMFISTTKYIMPEFEAQLNG